MLRKYIGLLLIFWSINGMGQLDSAKVKIRMFSAYLGYGIDWPSADLSARFGQSLNFSTGLEYLLNGRDAISLDYVYNFGSKIKEDIFLNFRNENGFVIGIDGNPSILFLRQRGDYFGLSYSRILIPTSLTSGLKVSLGAGYMSHRIRVVDDSRNLVIAEDPYLKGFDRFTKGFALKQELVYQHHSRDKAIHFNIGFNITEGFTKQVRKTNFDTGQSINTNRFDLLYGLRFTWMIPFSKSIEGTVNYY